MKLEAIGNWAEDDIIFGPMWHSKCLFFGALLSRLWLIGYFGYLNIYIYIYIYIYIMINF